MPRLTVLARLRREAVVGSVVRNVASQASGHVVGITAALAASVILTRYLGPERYGEYVFALTYVGFFGPLIRTGIDEIVVRELAGDETRNQQLLGAALGLKLLLGGTALVAAIALVGVLVAPQMQLAALVATPAVLVVALQGPGLVLQSRLKMHFRSVADVLGQATLLAAVSLLTYLGAGLLPMVGAYVLGTAVTALATAVFAHRIVSLSVSTDLALWKRVMRDAAPLAAAGVLHQLYYRVDVMILARYWNASAVGTYSVANGMFDQAVMLFSFVAGSLFPLMSRRHASEGALGRFVYPSVGLALAIAAAAVAGTLLLAEPVIRLLYGEAYRGAVQALQILSLAFPFRFVWYVMAFALITVNRQRSLVVATAAALLANILLNVALVPEFGYVASAWATVATEALIIGVVGVGLRRALR